MKKSCIAYTDGSSLGNPGPGGWGALVVCDGMTVAEFGGADKHTTNNKMELTACIEALKNSDKAECTIYTDSSYVINGITKWVHGWKKNNWMTKQKSEVLNRALWEALVAETEGREITWTHVPGHSGVPGNERADEIATTFALQLSSGQALRETVELYSGELKKYCIDVLAPTADTLKSQKRSADKSRSRAKAYSYVSAVDGAVYVDKTWTACEKRVKGKKGVKYKKALTAEEETDLVSKWRT